MKRAWAWSWVIAGTMAVAGPAGAVIGTNGEAPESSIMSLQGTWRFALDPKSEGMKGEWQNRRLADQLELPGVCEQQGFGVKPKPETVRLTRELKYVGPAWYQRDIEIPEQWAGQRIELFLERCRWVTTVWLDDQKIGSQDSLCTPQVHELGRLSPGRHVLTICVDNTYKLPIGTWTGTLSEDFQGNWNGIIGRLELRATDPVWIRQVRVFPSALKVHVGNQTGQAVEGTIQGRKVAIPAGGGEVEIPFDGNSGKAWNEFEPKRRSLKVSLSAGAYRDSKTISYAVRALSTRNAQITVNGRPVLLRGPIDCCVHPLTGYPPMDKAYWLQMLGVFKSYGFNFVRFHSWCPPEAAFAAGDELGFLFQVELPFWDIDAPHFGTPGQGPRDQFLREELNRMLDSYGNHPSFGIMAMGNESSGSLHELVQAGRQRDSRPLFRCENGNTKAHGDVVEDGLRGILGPRTDWDRTTQGGWIANGGMTGAGRTGLASGAALPTVTHEVGQWEMYANFEDAKKFTGPLKPLYLDTFRESLAVSGMLDQARDFFEASGQLTLLLYKEEIEACLRTHPFGGFQFLEIRDCPGQGVAMVGLLDAFWKSKGLITPEAFRRFCGSTVCLLRMPARVYTTADTFEARAEVSHYGLKDLKTNADWSMADERGRVLAKGAFPEAELRVGSVTPLGEIRAALAGVAAPARLVVTVRAAGTSNRWNLWVYPVQSPPAPAGVMVAYRFDQATRDALAAGKKVVLFSSPKEGVIPSPYRTFYGPESTRALPAARPGRNAVEGSFTPTFWNLTLFGQIGTMGILCDPKHPALAGFPTESHSDWQWADLLGNFSAAHSFRCAFAGPEVYNKIAAVAGDVSGRSKAIILNETPADFRPIVQVIDNYKRNAKLGVIFETKVGPGKLLVCAMDLDTDADKRPAARQLRSSLLAYAVGEKFAPKHELPLELLDRILTSGEGAMAPVRTSP